MREREMSENRDEMILEMSLPMVRAAWMKLTPSTPSASCCSWAVESSMRMWIMTVLGWLLHPPPTPYQPNRLLWTCVIMQFIGPVPVWLLHSQPCDCSTPP